MITLFIPVLHLEDYTTTKYSKLPRINSFWVKRVPTGNVTITSQSSAPDGISEVVSTITFPPSHCV